MPSSCLAVKSTNLLAGLCCALAQKPKYQAGKDTSESILISCSPLETSYCVCFRAITAEQAEKQSSKRSFHLEIAHYKAGI